MLAISNLLNNSYKALRTMLQVMAPIIPFMTDYIWQNLTTKVEQKKEKSQA